MIRRQGAQISDEAWPNEWLPRNGFVKLHDMGPGDRRDTTLTLTARDFSRWDTTARVFRIRTGAFEVDVRDCTTRVVVTVTQ